MTRVDFPRPCKAVTVERGTPLPTWRGRVPDAYHMPDGGILALEDDDGAVSVWAGGAYVYLPARAICWDRMAKNATLGVTCIWMG